jgi:hypothetical protein
MSSFFGTNWKFNCKVTRSCHIMINLPLDLLQSCLIFNVWLDSIIGHVLWETQSYVIWSHEHWFWECIVWSSKTMFAVFNLEVISTLAYSMRIMFRKSVVVTSDFENDHEWRARKALSLPILQIKRIVQVAMWSILTNQTMVHCHIRDCICNKPNLDVFMHRNSKSKAEHGLTLTLV